MTALPVKDKIKIHFNQAKATVQIPWPHNANEKENIISACIKPLTQITKELKVFIELAELLDLSFKVLIT